MFRILFIKVQVVRVCAVPEISYCSSQFPTMGDYNTCPSNLWMDACHVILSRTFEGESHFHSNSGQLKQSED